MEQSTEPRNTACAPYRDTHKIWRCKELPDKETASFDLELICIVACTSPAELAFSYCCRSCMCTSISGKPPPLAGWYKYSSQKGRKWDIETWNWSEIYPEKEIEREREIEGERERKLVKESVLGDMKMFNRQRERSWDGKLYTRK